MILLLHRKATRDQLDAMLQALEFYVKVAVDIQRGCLAGGGELHADCEAVLFEDGSRQEHIWGADWIPSSQEVRFEALINIRPNQGNPSMTILDPTICSRVEKVVRGLLEGV
jgi:hypothetical protein